MQLTADLLLFPFIGFTDFRYGFKVREIVQVFSLTTSLDMQGNLTGDLTCYIIILEIHL